MNDTPRKPRMGLANSTRLENAMRRLDPPRRRTYNRMSCIEIPDVECLSVTSRAGLFRIWGFERWIPHYAILNPSRDHTYWQAGDLATITISERWAKEANLV